MIGEGLFASGYQVSDFAGLSGIVDRETLRFYWLEFSKIRYSLDRVRINRLLCAIAGVDSENSFRGLRPMTSNSGPAWMT